MRSLSSVSSSSGATISKSFLGSGRASNWFSRSPASPPRKSSSSSSSSKVKWDTDEVWLMHGGKGSIGVS